ncbi:sirohydrochlorin cobaltochelatase [Guggenheimella bovis]
MRGILFVSFGTTHIEGIERAITPLTKSLQTLGLPLEQAFSSNIVRNRLKEKNRFEKSIEEAICALKEKGVTELIVPTTFLLEGLEYQKLEAKLKESELRYQLIKPILRRDIDAKELIQKLLKAFDRKEDELLLMMGHGTSDESGAVYQLLNDTSIEKGLPFRAFAIEGEPYFDSVKDTFKGSIFLAPLLYLSGEHANNDMIEFYEELKSLGFATRYTTVSLGELSWVREMIFEETKRAL